MKGGSKVPRSPRRNPDRNCSPKLLSSKQVSPPPPPPTLSDGPCLWEGEGEVTPAAHPWELGVTAGPLPDDKQEMLDSLPRSLTSLAPKSSRSPPRAHPQPHPHPSALHMAVWDARSLHPPGIGLLWLGAQSVSPAVARGPRGYRGGIRRPCFAPGGIPPEPEPPSGGRAAP